LGPVGPGEIGLWARGAEVAQGPAEYGVGIRFEQIRARHKHIGTHTDMLATLAWKEDGERHLEYDPIASGTVTNIEYGAESSRSGLNRGRIASDGHTMKLAVLAVVVLAAALVMLNRSVGPSVDPDVGVRVLTADPVRLVLPIDPDTNTIVAGIVGELDAAADAELNPALSQELRRISNDTEYLTWLAETGVEYFNSGQAIALAYALYNVDISGDPVILTSITAELVPQYGSVGYSADHENGHAFINAEIARRCGREIIREEATAGLRGERLRSTIISRLRAIGDRAHDSYHSHVNTGFVSSHLRFARQAAEDAIATLCAP
jgi:hypothetical protein